MSRKHRSKSKPKGHEPKLFFGNQSKVQKYRTGIPLYAKGGNAKLK